MIFSNQPDTPLLGINIDHVATLRNARGGRYPDPVNAALLAIEAGADIITFHLREDRRHIRDDDVHRLKAAVNVPLNFEAAVADEMLAIIEEVRPEHVCLVPERRLEVTTEGGLDVVGQFGRVRDACARLAEAGCRVSLFINADAAQIEASAKAGAPVVEIHTGAFANAWFAADESLVASELAKVRRGLQIGRSLGLQTNAGHGLALSGASDPDAWSATTRAVVSAQEPVLSAATQSTGAYANQPSSTYSIAALSEVAELHIGHALMGHAIFVGLRQAVADFRAEMVRGRAGASQQADRPAPVAR
ncbi:pyridoxine 5'-phosphate synthase [soil metagenome]